jgi:CBS domain containing-hemolysin-like protein
VYEHENVFGYSFKNNSPK